MKNNDDNSLLNYIICDIDNQANQDHYNDIPMCVFAEAQVSSI